MLFTVLLIVVAVWAAISVTLFAALAWQTWMPWMQAPPPARPRGTALLFAQVVTVLWLYSLAELAVQAPWVFVQETVVPWLRARGR